MAQAKKTSRKTTAKTTKSTKAKVATTAKAAAVTTGDTVARSVNLPVAPYALLGEILGTAILASVAITGNNGLFVGLSLFLVVLSLSGISAAHANPAVTLGLWAVRKFETAKALMYVLAQLLGGLLAFVLLQFFSRGDFTLSFASFGSFDGRLFLVEFIGTAVFVLGVTAALDRTREVWARALSIGLSLVVGMSVATGFLSHAIQSTPAENAAGSRLSKVDNVALNPAVALAMTERRVAATDAFGQETAPTTDTSTPPSRFTLETLGGALAGGIFGAALYTFLDAANRRSNGTKSNLV
jgi:glycerol uptake facilitator-like aquaporin